MRLLCLHGVGSSAEILENQLQPFLQAVDPAFEFVFVDGPVQCPRGPGVGPHIDGPFYSHTAGYSPGKMAEALDHFEETIEELGPFDGILGFSQGAALTISYMYSQQSRGEPVPFKFALIFSSVMPCSDDPDHFQDVLERLKTHRRPLTGPLVAGDVPLTREENLFLNLMLHTVIPARNNHSLLPDIDFGVYTDGDSDEAPRLMHPQLLKDRITVPTVHVTGKRDHDFMRNMSEVARGLCDERMVKKLEHSGGHYPPRRDDEIAAVLRAMDWAIAQSQKGSNLHL